MPARPLLPLALAAAVALAACGSTNSGGAGAPDVYHLTAERNGQTVQVAPGQRIAVVLPTVAGSPARWTPEIGDTSVLVPSGGPQTLAPRGGGGAVIGGAQGYERVEFQARASGTSSLRLTRVRPVREGGGVQTFQVTIQVGR